MVKTCLLLIPIISFSCSLALAQKDIVLSDDLAVNSQRLKVKMGTRLMGKIWKFKFGEYAVGNSKNGWHKESYSSNFFGTKVNVNSHQKFSFELASGGENKAIVDAATESRVEFMEEVDILPFFAIGDNKLLLESSNFSALISTSSDTADI